ncbi:hypothetical protein WMY93_029694 [Mugilogobius chulae]|uniref:SWIM-type domain-containing protein n=1 Tax=Mugilogobius chulae TaxID=88201 RepID=A0AAW0MPA2_9GOBI
MGHPNNERTLAALRQRCYWPRMAQDVKEWTEACLQCVCKKPGPDGRAALLPVTTSYPFEIVVPTTDQAADTTARAIYTHWIQTFGCPERILTDRGATFESSLMNQLCKLYGCQKDRTTAYHPQGNGTWRGRGETDNQGEQRHLGEEDKAGAQSAGTREKKDGEEPWGSRGGRCQRSQDRLEWAGWVKEMKQLRENGFCIVTAKVLHSQRLSAPPLQPWIIAEANGTVKSAHCTCMAGLGEVCSHVGALLFTVETVARIRDSMTVTQEKAYWLLPSGLKKIEYKPIRLMDFSSAKTKKKRLDEQVHSHCASDHQEKTPPCRPAKVTTPEMTDDELNTFFHQIQICGTKPVILSVIQGFSEAYIPKSLDKKFPPILTNLLDAECFDMEKTELLQKCSELRRNIFITAEQASQVERVSRFQAFSKEWHQFRLGRITASRLKSVCHTTVETLHNLLLKTFAIQQNFQLLQQDGAAHMKRMP